MPCFCSQTQRAMQLGGFCCCWYPRVHAATDMYSKGCAQKNGSPSMSQRINSNVFTGWALIQQYQARASAVTSADSRPCFGLSLSSMYLCDAPIEQLPLAATSTPKPHHRANNQRVHLQRLHRVNPTCVHAKPPARSWPGSTSKCAAATVLRTPPVVILQSTFLDLLCFFTAMAPIFIPAYYYYSFAIP